MGPLKGKLLFLLMAICDSVNVMGIELNVTTRGCHLSSPSIFLKFENSNKRVLGKHVEP